MEYVACNYKCIHFWMHLQIGWRLVELKLAKGYVMLQDTFDAKLTFRTQLPEGSTKGVWRIGWFWIELMNSRLYSFLGSQNSFFSRPTQTFSSSLMWKMKFCSAAYCATNSLFNHIWIELTAIQNRVTIMKATPFFHPPS